MLPKNENFLRYLYVCLVIYIIETLIESPLREDEQTKKKSPVIKFVALHSVVCMYVGVTSIPPPTKQYTYLFCSFINLLVLFIFIPSSTFHSMIPSIQQQRGI